MAAPQDRLLLELFARGQPGVIFDIGACTGSSGIHYGTMFPGAEVHAFEPVPANHDLVLANMALHPQVRMQAHRVALSDKEGPAVLHLSSAQGGKAADGNKSSSLLEPGLTTEVHPWLEFNERVTVDTLTLDAFCKARGITSIDFIHMDVQGAELLVLQGAKAMLPHVRSIWMEVERVALYKGQPVKRDVESFMRKHGFILAISTVAHLAGDQFWINSTFLQRQPPALRRKIAVDRMFGGLRMAFATVWGGLRYRARLRTRLRSLFGKS